MEEGEGSETQGKKKEQRNAKENKDLVEQRRKELLITGTGEQENDTEEMELGELDLDSIEKACDNLNEDTFPLSRFPSSKNPSLKPKDHGGWGQRQNP